MTLQVIPAKRNAYVLQMEYSNNENMEYFKQQIDEKVGSEDYNTNVKGKMTDYHAFIKDSTFANFIKEFVMPEIRKYQQVFPIEQSMEDRLRLRMLGVIN